MLVELLEWDHAAGPFVFDAAPDRGEVLVALVEGVVKHFDGRVVDPECELRLDALVEVGEKLVVNRFGLSFDFSPRAR